MPAFLSNPYFLLLFTVQAVFVVRWAHRETRNKEIYENFVRSIASNHLPHIFDMQMTTLGGLNKLLEIYGLEQIRPTLPPPIEFVDLDRK